MDSVPMTLDEAVAVLIEGMSDEDKATVRGTPRDRLILFHLTWGMGIRNAFGLWGDNRELCAALGDLPADEASMVIMRAVWDRLQRGA